MVWGETSWIRPAMFIVPRRHSIQTQKKIESILLRDTNDWCINCISFYEAHLGLSKHCISGRNAVLRVFFICVFIVCKRTYC